MKKIFSWFLVSGLMLSASLALANSGTLSVLDSTGAPQSLGVTVDGSGNKYGNYAIVDGAAAANKATVDSANRLSTNPSDNSISASLSSVGTVVLPVSGTNTVSVLASGSGTGLSYTLQVEDQSGTWQSVWYYSANPGEPLGGIGTASQSAQSALFYIQVGGFQAARVNLTAISGGTETFSLRGSLAPPPSQPVELVAPGGSQLAINADGSLNSRTATTPSVVCNVKLPINQTASTDLHTFTNHIYICGITLVTATAQNISVVAGTGTTCGTSTEAMIGGTTASMAFAANGGMSSMGFQPTEESTGTGQHLCVLQSSTGNVSGVILAADAS